MRAVLVDTAVALHADGADHPLREPCRTIIGAAAEGVLEGHANVELVQEYVHVARRRGGAIARIERRLDLIRRVLQLHPFTEAMVPSMLEALRAHSQLQTRDAIHVATALDLSIGSIVSPDRHFEGIDGITRIDPLDEDAVAELTGGRSAS